ncbi:DUF732 domain-containing protein [Mycolicibacter minnesotensis]
MNARPVAAVLSLLLVGGLGALTAPAFAEPSEADQVFFDDLQQHGLRPSYDRPVCDGGTCKPLRDLLVGEGHEVCLELGEAPRLVPVSVIADLQVSPKDARIIINAARHAYCPQAPDPYVRSA